MYVFYNKKQNKNIVIFTVVFITLMVINPFGMFDIVRNIIMIPFTPIAQQGSAVGTYIFNKIDMVSSIGILYSNNQDLENKVRELKAENAKLSDVKNENNKLRNILELLPRDKFKFIGGDVILRDSLGGNQWIMINKGQKDGIIIGKAVVVDKNILVGVIDKVNKTTARIQLLTHPNSLINAVSARTGAQGIIVGVHGLSLKVEDINVKDDVVNGDTFVTSDIGNSFPRGLSIGTVQNIALSKDQLFKTATILPSVALDKLQYVFVIK